MAFTMQIDGSNLIYVSHIDWADPIVDTSLDLIAVRNAWRICTIRGESWTAADWVTLRSKRGAIVSLTVNDPDSRNADFVTYYGARVLRVSYRQHLGPLIRGVFARFAVPT